MVTTSFSRDLPGCQTLRSEMALLNEDTDTWLRSLDGALSDDKPLDYWPNQWATVFVSAEGNADFKRLLQLACNFVLLAFNSKRDLENQTLKVLPTVPGKDPYLVMAVVIFALQDYLAWCPEATGPKAWSEESLAKFVQFCNDILADTSSTTREKRALKQATRQTLRREGYVLSHDTKILKAAETWYKCRVNPGTIEAYLDEVSKTTEKDLERWNVSNAIAPYDEATGYPRKWRK